MLKDFKIDEFKNIYENEKRSDLGKELAYYQRICMEENIPVIIMIEGWESSGKGYVLNDLVRELDTKNYKVSIFKDLKDNDDYFYTHQFWEHMPAKGHFAIFDCSMYYHMFNDLNSNEDIEKIRIKQIMNLEKILYDDHTILIKFFLHQSKKRQKKAIEEYIKSDSRKFLVSEEDIDQNQRYEDYLNHFDLLLSQTDFDIAPWNIVSSENRKSASKYILGKTLEIVKSQIDYIRQRRKAEESWKHSDKNIPDIIGSLDLDKGLDEKEYKNQIKDLQKKAGDLAYSLHTKGIPAVLVFEGQDASGKGGAIQRLLRRIDARSYSINPTSAPSDLEKDHHYLWRFYNNLPKDGYIAVFDRSWYGRVMVERVEGFANEFEWSRAYREINDMEKELTDYGALVIKYLIVISKEEQEERFKKRQKEKPYKITEEDWRNREKWDDYVLAINEMLYNTNTSHAPWKVIEGNDKKYARVEVLKEFIKRAEEILKEN
ncbi:hypothetical protein [Peptoniphilus catoniae]|uniref:hypothetical protein n=1 Tax=Peptoniphilus catoniae TaxID=1660341 RepID=UPI0010FDBFF1|nr:hypothetical protein [Peptoniphilus catoniae]